MTGVTPRYDDSLPLLVARVRQALGAEALRSGAVLRDASGRLAFFAGTELASEVAEQLSTHLRDALGPYAKRDRVVVLPSAFGADAILKDKRALPMHVDGLDVRVVDRRIVGADWLQRPAPIAEGPPRFVFTSLKGGVGRSTALAVAAAHLAARGQRVLVVDLDLEAPGQGAFLLDDDTVSELGVLDALVELNLGELDPSFYADLIGPSPLAGGRGKLDVVPAFGRRSLRCPADVLGKLARAYTEAVLPGGQVFSFLDKVRGVLDHFAVADQYDAILVDARAGLHESTAASVLGLGADVFLFAVDEPQTFAAYPALMAHLARFVPPGEPPEWVERLWAVQAKAPADAERRRSFADSWRALVDEHGPLRQPSAPSEVPLPDDFGNPGWDDSVPEGAALPSETELPEPIAVLDDERFRGFDPLRRRDQVSERLYRATFGELLDKIEGAVLPAEIP